MKKRLSVIIIVILVVAAAAEFILPRLVESQVAAGLSNITGSNEVNVEIHKRPAIAMVGGKFDQVLVQAANARIDKITFAKFDIAMTDVALNMGDLLSQREVVIKSVRDVNLTAVITAEELAHYLNQTVKGVKNATVTIDSGKVRVSSSFSLGSFASVVITLDGHIASDGQKLKFVTERFLLNNNVVGGMGGGLLAEIPLVDLKKLPFGVTVRTITLEDGKVTLVADNLEK